MLSFISLTNPGLAAVTLRPLMKLKTARANCLDRVPGGKLKLNSVGGFNSILQHTLAGDPLLLKLQLTGQNNTLASESTRVFNTAAGCLGECHLASEVVSVG